MAINLNLEKYGAQFNVFVNFANENASNPDSLVRVDAGSLKELLCPEGKPRAIVAKNDGDEIKGFSNPFFSRKQNQIDLNNEVRNLFKETVLKICGAKSLDDLPKAVLSVMRKGDYDNDGHPLSVRRIRAVTSAIIAEAGKETGSMPSVNQIQATPEVNSEDEVANTEDKVNSENEANSKDEVNSEDEVESSVDDDEDESFEYETPGYVSGLPPETEVKFMEFYCAAVKETLKDGRTKEDCDNTLKEMFREVGYDKNDRKLLVELIAGGKPRFLDEDGRLPFDLEAVRFAKDFKSVLDLTKRYRAKLPKAYGDLVADTILETLKSGNRMFVADDLKVIDAELCEDIAAAAKEIDTGKLLSPPPGKSRSARSLAKALDAFQREAAGKFASDLLKPNDSELMTKIKQRLLLSMAIAQSGAAAESLAEEIEVYSDDLVEKYGMQDLLTAIAPELKRVKSL